MDDTPQRLDLNPGDIELARTLIHQAIDAWPSGEGRLHYRLENQTLPESREECMRLIGAFQMQAAMLAFALGGAVTSDDVPPKESAHAAVNALEDATPPPLPFRVVED